MKLPNFLCPKYKCELIRLGGENDGGYSVPKKSLEKTKIVEVGEKETKPTVETKNEESKKEAPKLDIKKKN